MSASPAPVLDALALQLLAGLEEYKRDVGLLAASWLDMDRYNDVSNQIELIRAQSAALPQLSAQWVELLIAHSELMHCLWRSQSLPEVERVAAIAEATYQHSRCVNALQERCSRCLVRRPNAAAPPV